MKKLLVVAVIALLALALVACGGDDTATTTAAATTAGNAVTTTPAVTTEGTVTTTVAPATDDVVTTTVGTAETTTAPSTDDVVTTTGGTTETTTPITTVGTPDTKDPTVYDEIEALMETSWWQQVHRMNAIQYSRDTDGTHYIWSLTIKAESQLFPYFPEDHELYPGMPSLQASTAEGAFVYIRNMNNPEEDFVKYEVATSSWRTERWCDIWFEAVGFTPVADGLYDMYLFFVSPEGSANPGDYVYVWALEEPWTYNAPVYSGIPEIDQHIAVGYQCTVHRHSERADISWAEANATDKFDPATFPNNTFNFTVKAEDGLFPHLANGESFQEIIPEGAFAYIIAEDGTVTRYDVAYMLTERHCDMWFTLEGFTPVVGEKYNMYFFFMSGAGATNPHTLHFVYSDSWMAGAGEPKT